VVAALGMWSGEPLDAMLDTLWSGEPLPHTEAWYPSPARTMRKPTRLAAWLSVREAIKLPGLTPLLQWNRRCASSTTPRPFVTALPCDRTMRPPPCTHNPPNGSLSRVAGTGFGQR
jgi:hypothetical protein